MIKSSTNFFLYFSFRINIITIFEQQPFRVEGRINLNELDSRADSLPKTFDIMTKEEELDRDGLRVLRWSMFDSPDSPGSGYKFMEREPVIALDRAAHKYEYRPNVILGYTSKPVADKMRLASVDSHRVGHAVRIRCVGARKRLKLIRTLMEQGVMRFAVDRETVYYDTDPLKPPAFHIWE